jgi:hypothetical protein
MSTDIQKELVQVIRTLEQLQVSTISRIRQLHGILIKKLLQVSRITGHAAAYQLNRDVASWILNSKEASSDQNFCYH